MGLPTPVHNEVRVIHSSSQRGQQIEDVGIVVPQAIGRVCLGHGSCAGRLRRRLDYCSAAGKVQNGARVHEGVKLDLIGKPPSTNFVTVLPWSMQPSSTRPGHSDMLVVEWWLNTMSWLP